MSDLHEKFVETQLDLFEQRKREELRITLEAASSPDRMLQFFTYSHLPEQLAAASLPFCQLAEEIVAKYPMNPERTVCLRKLLEAKDAAVRTLLYKG
jgi:hypothetical protein